MENKYDVKWINFSVPDDAIKVYLDSKGTPSETSRRKHGLKEQFRWFIGENSTLKDAISFPRSSTYCVYNADKGTFVEFHKAYLSTHVTTLMEPWKKPFYLSAKEMNNLADDVHLDFRPRDQESFSNDLLYIPFSNGNYNIRTKEFLKGFTPNIELSYRLSFPYTESEECPMFKNLLSFIANGHQDRYDLLRSEAYTIIFSLTKYYNWMHLCGDSHGGKTQYANTMICLVGDEVHAESSVSALSKYKFEPQHLQGKKLITLSESEDYTKDIETVKRYTGGDTLVGSHKHIDNRDQFRAVGRVLMVGNYELRIRDSGNAIRNRHLFVKCEQSFQKGTPLIAKDEISKEWSGPMLHELPFIHAYIRNTDPLLVDYMMQGIPVSCPSQLEIYHTLLQDMSPVTKFVEENMVVGKFCYLGYVGDKNKRSEAENVSRRSVYPAYLSWCKRFGDTPYKVKTFSANFLAVCKDLKLPVRKEKDRVGAIFIGLELRKDFYDLDMQYGAIDTSLVSTPPPPKIPTTLVPLALQADPDKDLSLDPGFEVPSNVYEADRPLFRKWHQKSNKSLDPFMYEKYIGLFGKTPFKVELQKMIRLFMRDESIVHDATERFMNLSLVTSDTFKERVLQTVRKDVKVISKQGFLCYEYKLMAASPRIHPLKRGGGPNAVKRSLRSEIFRRSGDWMEREHEMVLVDFDLKACYTSVILGLFPEELTLVAKCMRAGGIWKEVERMFEEKQLSSSFHKDSVKVCIYSSFFEGRYKAMKTGIADKFIEGAGITKKEYENSTWSTEVNKFAGMITDFMLTNPLCEEFMNLSETLKSNWDQSVIVGPTGYEQLVDKNNFRRTYANLLQSYEISLVAQASIEMSMKFPTVEFLLSLHDGFTCAVPKDLVEDVTKELNSIIETTRLNLLLKNPQYLEVQSTYGKEENRHWTNIDPESVDLSNEDS